MLTAGEVADIERGLRPAELPLLCDDATCTEVAGADAIMRHLARVAFAGGRNEGERIAADVAFAAAAGARRALLLRLPAALCVGGLVRGAPPLPPAAASAEEWARTELPLLLARLDALPGGPRFVCDGAVTYADVAVFEFLRAAAPSAAALAPHERLRAFMADMAAHAVLSRYLTAARVTSVPAAAPTTAGAGAVAPPAPPA